MSATALRLSLLALALLPGVASAAPKPVDPWGCACLRNGLDTKVSYRYRWGLDEWHTVGLAPNATDRMCWAYKGASRTPTLNVEMDVDLTSGTTKQMFSLHPVPAPERACSAVGAPAQYHFGYVPNSNRRKIKVLPGAK